MSQPQNPAIDPNQVPIHFTLNLAQVNLILKGLGKLPHEEVEQLYNGIRSSALNTLQTAEKAALDAIAAATDAPNGADEVTA